MRPLRFLPLAAVLIAAGCASGGWDPLAVQPAPVRLPAGADTLSAHAYYNYGQSILERTPDRAADAFYWAYRFDPLWAEPLYARRMALLMSRLDVYEDYTRGSRRTLLSPGVQRVDSLYLKALLISPFLLRRQDAPALRYAIVEAARRDAGGQIDEARLRYVLDVWLQQTSFATKGWLAHSEGRLHDAARLYERAITERSSPELHVDLARVYFMTGRREDAKASMARAIERFRERDDERLVYLYRSKALYEHTLGMILEETGEVDEARLAYARALQEDLGYHPSHMRLGEMALVAGDTITALSEMALAAEIRPDDAGVRLRYGRVLAGAGQHQEAVAQFQAAIELEPYFAQPHVDLAGCFEALSRASEAIVAYRTFLAKASRDHGQRRAVENRLRELGTRAGSSS